MPEKLGGDKFIYHELSKVSEFSSIWTSNMIYGSFESMTTMSVVGEQEAFAPEGKAGGEMLEGGGHWQPIENLVWMVMIL